MPRHNYIQNLSGSWLCWLLIRKSGLWKQILPLFILYPTHIPFLILSSSFILLSAFSLLHPLPSISPFFLPPFSINSYYLLFILPPYLFPSSFFPLPLSFPSLYLGALYYSLISAEQSYKFDDHEQQIKIQLKIANRTDQLELMTRQNYKTN